MSILNRSRSDLSTFERKSCADQSFISPINLHLLIIKNHPEIKSIQLISDAEKLVLDTRRADVHKSVVKHRAENKPTVKNQLNALKIKFKRVNDENN